MRTNYTKLFNYVMKIILRSNSTTANLDEQLNFDINQLKYCIETDIVDDFVLL